MTASALERRRSCAIRYEAARSRAGTFQVRGRHFSGPDVRVGVAGACAAARRRGLAVRRRLSRLQGIRFRLPPQRFLEPAQGAFRRRRGDLRHARDLDHRHGDRRSGRPRHCGVSDRTLPDPAAPADRHRDRTARRHSLDHLRHLGRLLFQAGHAGLHPAGDHRDARQRFPASAICSAGRRSATAS